MFYYNKWKEVFKEILIFVFYIVEKIFSVCFFLEEEVVYCE